MRFLSDTLEKDVSAKNKNRTCVTNCGCVVKIDFKKQPQTYTCVVITLRGTVQWQVMEFSGFALFILLSFQQAGIQSRKTLANCRIFFGFSVWEILEHAAAVVIIITSRCMNLYRIRSSSAKWIRERRRIALGHIFTFQIQLVPSPLIWKRVEVYGVLLDHMLEFIWAKWYSEMLSGTYPHSTNNEMH